MSPAVRSVLAGAFLLVCAAPDAQELPEGISCAKCQREPGMPCNAAWLNQALVAEASGTVAADEEISCMFDDPPPDAYNKCTSTRTWRFESLRVLSGAQSATAKDIFQAATYYDYWAPERRRGIVLREHTRYLLVAANAHSDSRPRANWRLAFACEVLPD